MANKIYKSCLFGSVSVLNDNSRYKKNVSQAAYLILPLFSQIPYFVNNFQLTHQENMWKWESCQF